MSEHDDDALDEPENTGEETSDRLGVSGRMVWVAVSILAVVGVLLLGMIFDGNDGELRPSDVEEVSEGQADVPTDATDGDAGEASGSSETEAAESATTSTTTPERSDGDFAAISRTTPTTALSAEDVPGFEETEEGQDQPSTTLAPEIEAALATVIQASTTVPAQEADVIDDIGEEVIEAWWFNRESQTFGELADQLESEGVITDRLAEEWRGQGDQPVESRAEELTVTQMETVRVEPDNATYQIAASPVGDEGEFLTFLEFVLTDGVWKVDGVA